MRINRTAQPSVFQPDEVVHPLGSQGCDPKLWMALMRQPADRGDWVALGAIA